MNTERISLEPNFFMNKFNIDLANAIVRLDNKINTTFNKQFEKDLDLESERSDHPLSGSAYMREDSWITYLFPSLGAYDPYVDWTTKVTYKQFLLDPEVKLLADTIGKVTVVDSRGGEGRGEDLSTVYLFENWDLYIEFYGYYASHYGSDYQGCRQVTPKAKVAYDWIPV